LNFHLCSVRKLGSLVENDDSVLNCSAINHAIIVTGAFADGQKQKPSRIARSRVDDIVVFGVSSDPKPCDDISFADGERAVVVVDADRPEVGAEFFEMEGRMEGLVLPECEFGACEFLNCGR
jgi:hypothetical protein